MNNSVKASDFNFIHKFKYLKKSRKKDDSKG
jgi:hypothetical protein